MFGCTEPPSQEVSYIPSRPITSSMNMIASKDPTKVTEVQQRFHIYSHRIFFWVKICHILKWNQQWASIYMSLQSFCDFICFESALETSFGAPVNFRILSINMHCIKSLQTCVSSGLHYSSQGIMCIWELIIAMIANLWLLWRLPQGHDRGIIIQYTSKAFVAAFIASPWVSANSNRKHYMHARSPNHVVDGHGRPERVGSSLASQVLYCRLPSLFLLHILVHVLLRVFLVLCVIYNIKIWQNIWDRHLYRWRLGPQTWTLCSSSKRMSPKLPQNLMQYDVKFSSWWFLKLFLFMKV